MRILVLGMLMRQQQTTNTNNDTNNDTNNNNLKQQRQLPGNFKTFLTPVLELFRMHCLCRH